MTRTMQFTIGADATCTDGVCGQVTRVVINPVTETVTHLVIKPEHQHAAARLVPIDLLDTTNGEIHLRCAVTEYEGLAPAEETHFLPNEDHHYAGYGPGQTYIWPYYGAGGLGMGMWDGGGNGGFGTSSTSSDGAELITTDFVPAGEVAVYRGDRVIATDGTIGHVQGLVIAAPDHHITHILLREGHLFGRKEVAIPIGAVTSTDEGIQLNITKQQVEDLPPVDVTHPGSQAVNVGP